MLVQSFLILPLQISVALALSWPLLAPRVSHLPTVSQEEPTLENELMLLTTKQGQLDAHARRTDCFKIATSFIKSRCGEDDMDEMERVKAAISMTLCELATAKHHTPPLECVPYTVDALVSNAPSPTSTSISPDHCVEALSRSAQFWSSYSGYLRDIPQLCFAFRRWNDIDTARDVYKKTTLDKISLLQSLLSHQDQEKILLQTTKGNVERMQDLMGYADNVLSNLNEAGNRLEERYRIMFDQILDSVSSGFKIAAQDLVVLQQQTMSQLESSAELLARGALVSSEALVLGFKSTLEHQATIASSMLRDYSSEVAEAMLLIHGRSKSLQQEYLGLVEQLDGMFTSASLASAMIDATSGQAVLLLESQQQARIAASSLLESAREAQDTLYTLGSGLQGINETVMSLKDGLYDANQWALGNVNKRTAAYMMALLGATFGLDLDSLKKVAFYGVPLTRAVFHAVQLMLYLVQTVASSIMSVGLVIFSLKRTAKTRECVLPPQSVNEEVIPPPPYEHIPRISHVRQRYQLYRHSCPINGRFSRIPDRLYHARKEDLASL